MASAWLGLGGNIGDVTAAMAAALQMLDAEPEIAVEMVSPIYKTPPWGLEDQPWFLNCCAQIATTLDPEALLTACQATERAGLRERTIRWGPRTIDIDIIAYDGVEQVEQRLTIPHPRALERAFVLVPLSDIAPDLVISGRRVADQAKAMDTSDIEKADTDDLWWKQPG